MDKNTMKSHDKAIDTMDYDVQFSHLLDGITDKAKRVFFLTEYADICAIVNVSDEKRNSLKAALIIGMFGVK